MRADEQQLICSWIAADNMRMDCLKAVAELNLPDCYIAAGFVRNLIWDKLTQRQTQLADIDVIYFDRDHTSETQDRYYERLLERNSPINEQAGGKNKWSVKNQARMHVRNGDLAYESSLDAMSYWPEKETAIGVRLDENGGLELGLAFIQFNYSALTLTHNPKRAREIFQQRIIHKNWLTHWPELKVVVNSES